MKPSVITTRANGAPVFMAASLSILLMSACAALQNGQQVIGMSEADVRDGLGAPTDTYTLSDGTQRWIYSTQPFGAESYVATFDGDGKVAKYEQALVSSELNKAIVGKWTKRDVAENFGRPRIPVEHLSLMDLEVWTYRVGQPGDWHVLYHFHFDKQGTLSKIQVTPDPLFDVLT